MADAPRDGNFVPAMLFVGSDGATYPVEGDKDTGRLYVDVAGGSGTVTSVSVVSANGFAGTVANATTTPEITLSTTVTGITKGNGTALSAAVAGTDYTDAAFKTISVAGQSDVVADSPADTLTLAAGSNITITTNAGTDTITIAAAGGGGGTITGTIAATQVAYGAGADEITGSANLVFDGTNLTIAGDASVGDDLLLTSSGSVINWNAGDITLTHSAGQLALTGGNLRFDNNTLLLFKATTDNNPGIIYTDTSNVFNVSTESLTYPMRLSASEIQLRAGNGTATYAILKTTNIATSDKTFEFPNTSGTLALTTGGALALAVGTTTITSGADTRILYDNSGTLGEYTITGTGTVVAMGTNPTLSGITMADNTNIVINTTTGTKIGTGTTQKIGFFNATPIVQPTGDIVTAMQNLGLGASLTVAGATTITVADEATDTTCFPVFVTAATGTLGPKTNAGLTFNSNTSALFSTLLSGNTITANTAFVPDTDGGADLGTTSLGFQNLHLNTGATINIDNGNWVATHTSAVLTVGTGDLRVTTAGTNSASVVTVGGTQTLTSKTLTSPTITTATLSGAQQLAEGASIRLDAAGSADGAYSGITIAGTAGATLAFGDLVYLAAADSRWELTDADAASTANVLIGMCVLAAASDGDPTVLLLHGNIRADAAFPAMTISARMYMGETAGDIQATIPTGADAIIRAVGYALTADELYFCPSMDSQATVA